MIVTISELEQIVAKVIEYKRIRGQCADMLRVFAYEADHISPAERIAKRLIEIGHYGATGGSVHVQVIKLRKQIEGTGLRLKTFRGKGGGLMLEYAP